MCTEEGFKLSAAFDTTHIRRSRKVFESGGIGIARILSEEVHFFGKKVEDLFLVVAFKDRLNLPQNLSHVAKTVLKIDSCSGWGGVHFVSRGCTYTFFL